MQQLRRNKEKTILLTGGHAGATAYAFVQALKKNTSFDWNIHFIGSQSAVEGSGVETLESTFLPELGVKYHSAITGRIQRKFTLQTIPSILKIPLGFIQTISLLKRIKPDIILSFGGFTSFPVVFWGWVFRIPVFVHEQTAAYGRANKLSEKFANKILLSREESLKFFDKGKSIITGNPISEGIVQIGHKSKLSNPPTIFVTGGSRGSKIINENILKILPSLLKKYKVVHQVGLLNEAEFSDVKRDLGSLGNNYSVYGVINPSEWAKFVENSDLIISRAGANIVSEIMTAKRPAILIPIPWSFADEQTKNAEVAEKHGIATILPQSELSPDSLNNSIKMTIDNWQKMVTLVKDKMSIDSKASEHVVEVIVDRLK